MVELYDTKLRELRKIMDSPDFELRGTGEKLSEEERKIMAEKVVNRMSKSLTDFWEYMNMLEVLSHFREEFEGKTDYTLFIQMLREIYVSMESSISLASTELGINFSKKDAYPDKYPVEVPWGGFREKKKELQSQND